MKLPDGLHYSKEHEWTLVENGVAVVGITDFAQDELGDIVFVELPEVGARLNQNETFGVAESVKTVSDLYSPVGGEVIEINAALADSPELVNESPYENGWMIKIRMSGPSELEGLMSAEEYGKHIQKNK